MSGADPRAHARRFPGGPERLRSPERMALLEIARVVLLSTEALSVRSVLDVGTGTGIFAEAFAGDSRRVAGIDINAEFLSVARRLLPGVELKQAAAENLPFDDRSFDLVFLGQVLHETDDPSAALEEARRVALKRVVVLEWPYRAEEKGPPLEHRLESSKILELAGRAGYGSVEKIELAHLDLYRMTPPARAPSTGGARCT
jgi:ubiquinone/menaquinone biosynthesis C-methylase UbiE